MTQLVGIIGLILLFTMLCFSIKNHKHPYEKEIEQMLKEQRELAQKILKRIKDKRK